VGQNELNRINAGCLSNLSAIAEIEARQSDLKVALLDYRACGESLQGFLITGRADR
jgi:hypothetical protein